jgi:acyl carrier protein
MNKNQLKKVIKQNIDSKEVKNIETDEWDSLSHLNILMELEKTFPRKITSIDGIAEANNYKKLKNILVSKKILSND